MNYYIRIISVLSYIICLKHDKRCKLQRRNFMGLSINRVGCQIHNSAHKSFSDVYQKSIFLFLKTVFFICGFSSKMICSKTMEKLLELNKFHARKKTLIPFILFNRLSYHGYRCESHACPSLNGGSLVSTMKIPLKQRWDFKSLNPMSNCFTSFLSMKTRALKRENPKMVGFY